MSQEIEEVVQEEEQIHRNSPDYQRWLAERSCSIYVHKTRSGMIYTKEHPGKVDYMIQKRIKLLLLNCNFAIFFDKRKWRGVSLGHE